MTGRLMLVAVLVLTLSLGAAATAAAVTLKGVELPDQVVIDGRECRLNGAGIRTKFFISVYAGALYLSTPTGEAAAAMAADEPKRIVMHFLYSVDAKTIRETWEEGFRNNTPAADLELLRARIDRLMSLLDEDVVKGDVISLTYLPGRGTELSVKGKVKGVIEGADFMKSLWAVWLGEKVADKGLKKALLGAR